MMYLLAGLLLLVLAKAQSFGNQKLCNYVIYGSEYLPVNACETTANTPSVMYYCSGGYLYVLSYTDTACTKLTSGGILVEGLNYNCAGSAPCTGVTVKAQTNCTHLKKTQTNIYVNNECIEGTGGKHQSVKTTCTNSMLTTTNYNQSGCTGSIISTSTTKAGCHNQTQFTILCTKGSIQMSPLLIFNALVALLALKTLF